MGQGRRSRCRRASHLFAAVRRSARHPGLLPHVRRPLYLWRWPVRLRTCSRALSRPVTSVATTCRGCYFGAWQEVSPLQACWAQHWPCWVRHFAPAGSQTTPAATAAAAPTAAAATPRSAAVVAAAAAPRPPRPSPLLAAAAALVVRASPSCLLAPPVDVSTHRPHASMGHACLKRIVSTGSASRTWLKKGWHACAAAGCASPLSTVFVAPGVSSTSSDCGAISGGIVMNLCAMFATSAGRPAAQARSKAPWELLHNILFGSSPR